MKKLTVNILLLATAVLGFPIPSHAQGAWTNKANLPQAYHVNGGRSFGVAALNGKFYTVGGLNWPNPISTVLEYDPVSDTWTPMASMLSPRYAPAAASVNGKLYAIGGSVNSSTTLTASIEEYDPVANAWTNKASMNQVRYAHQAVALNGKIYVLGEQGPGDVALDSVEEYDPISNTWSNRATMPTPRVSFGAAVVDGKIYAIGGRIGNTPIAPVHVYDPASDTWQTKASLPSTRETLAAVTVHGKIWAIGGYSTAGGTPHSPVEEYCPTCDAWTSKSDLPTLRNECFAVLLGDSLYVFGGYDVWAMQAKTIPPPTTPTVVVLPAVQMAPVGSNATFCASASGALPLAYQWWFNRTNLIAGATTYSLTLTNVQTTDAGKYSATVSNSSGTTTSLTATLTVAVAGDSDGDGLADGYESGALRYQIIPGSFAWLDAKADAELRGGHLATITSQAEWDLVFGLFGNSLLSAFLGGTDAGTEGTWRWVTGEPWEFTRWSPGQPDNAGGTQHYLWLHPSGGLLWDDTHNAGPPSFYLLEFGHYFYSDPNNPDTDGDGLTDGEEVNVYHTLPNVADSDSDGLSDRDEIEIYYTNPLKADTDGDNLADGQEVNMYSTNPLKADSDDDGLNDYAEVITYQTNPLSADTDGDGFNDYAEVYAGKNPKNAAEFPAALLGAFTAIELEFITQTNKTYFIQSSTNLTNWTNFDGPIVGNGNIWSKTYSTRPQGKLFYRVELSP